MLVRVQSSRQTMGMWRNGLAQLTVNQEVVGSNPSIPAKFKMGRYVKWSTTFDCKSNASGFGGSNPSLPTRKH